MQGWLILARVGPTHRLQRLPQALLRPGQVPGYYTLIAAERLSPSARERVQDRKWTSQGACGGKRTFLRTEPPSTSDEKVRFPEKDVCCEGETKVREAGRHRRSLPVAGIGLLEAPRRSESHFQALTRERHAPAHLLGQNQHVKAESHGTRKLHCGLARSVRSRAAAGCAA
jgi:hypothetical protein